MPQRPLSFSLALIASLLACAPAVAQMADEPPPSEAPAEDDAPPAEHDRGEDPTIHLSLYFFIPARIQGSAGVGGSNLDINTTFSDLYRNTDVGSLAGRLEVWPSAVGGVLDGYYSRIEADETRVRDLPNTTASLRARLDFRLGIVDMLAGLRPLDLALTDLIQVQLDLFAGARVVDLKETVRFDVAGVGTTEAGDSHNWVELAFGLRTRVRVGWFYATVAGDISGFGIGSGSDYIANLLLGLGFQPADIISLELAYRVLDMDYSRGSGRKQLAFDVTQHGPQLTIGLHF